MTDAGVGQSTCIGIGGDPIIGTTFLDVLQLFAADPETEAIVLIGEIGGAAEEEAAAWAAEHLRDLPEGRLHRRPDGARGQADGPRRRDHLGRRRDGRVEGRGARGGRVPRRRLARPSSRRSSATPATAADRRMSRLMDLVAGRRAARSCWSSASTTSPRSTTGGGSRPTSRSAAASTRPGSTCSPRPSGTVTGRERARATSSTPELELDGPGRRRRSDDRARRPGLDRARWRGSRSTTWARSPAAGSTSSRRSSGVLPREEKPWIRDLAGRLVAFCRAADRAPDVLFAWSLR